MFARENSHQRSDCLTEPSAFYAIAPSLDMLIQKYQRVNIKLEVIADEVPCDDFDIDAMVSRERKLYAEKQQILQSLQSAEVTTQADARTVAQILKNESILDGNILQTVFGSEPVDVMRGVIDR